MLLMMYLVKLVIIFSVTRSERLVIDFTLFVFFKTCFWWSDKRSRPECVGIIQVTSGGQLAGSLIGFQAGVNLHCVLVLDIRDKAPAPQDTTFYSKTHSTDIPGIHKSQWSADIIPEHCWIFIRLVRCLFISCNSSSDSNSSYNSSHSFILTQSSRYIKIHALDILYV